MCFLLGKLFNHESLIVSLFLPKKLKTADKHYYILGIWHLSMDDAFKERDLFQKTLDLATKGIVEYIQYKVIQNHSKWEEKNDME